MALWLANCVCNCGGIIAGWWEGPGDRDRCFEKAELYQERGHPVSRQPRPEHAPAVDLWGCLRLMADAPTMPELTGAEHEALMAWAYDLCGEVDAAYVVPTRDSLPQLTVFEALLAARAEGWKAAQSPASGAGEGGAE